MHQQCQNGIGQLSRIHQAIDKERLGYLSSVKDISSPPRTLCLCQQIKWIQRLENRTEIQIMPPQTDVALKVGGIWMDWIASKLLLYYLCPLSQATACKCQQINSEQCKSPTDLRIKKFGPNYYLPVPIFYYTSFWGVFYTKVFLIHIHN